MAKNNNIKLGQAHLLLAIMLILNGAKSNFTALKKKSLFGIAAELQFRTNKLWEQ